MLSQQCAAVSSVLAALHKLLRLNKKHTGNCQRVKQTARWCLAGQGLPPTLCYFPSKKKTKTVLLQSHGRSGRWCPLHTPNNWSAGLRARGWMSTKQWGEPSRIRICLSTVTFSGQIHERNPPPPPPTLRGGNGVILGCRFGPQGVEGRCLRCCLLLWFSSWFVLEWLSDDTFIIPHTSIPIVPMSRTILNFEALQWITLRNRVANLSALNLYSRSFNGTFGRRATFQKNTTRPFSGALCVTCNVLVNDYKNPSLLTFYFSIHFFIDAKGVKCDL